MSEFDFTPIDEFDAPRGYKRCRPPGVGSIGAFRANADLWRDNEGGVVVRFSNCWSCWSYSVSETGGKKIADVRLPDLCEELDDVLRVWVGEGPPDVAPL